MRHYLDSCSVQRGVFIADGWSECGPPTVSYENQPVMVDSYVVLRSDLPTYFGAGSEQWGFRSCGILPRRCSKHAPIVLRFPDGTVIEVPEAKFQSTQILGPSDRCVDAISSGVVQENCSNNLLSEFKVRDRKDILVEGLSKAGKLIEIGPSYNPLAAKRDGWNVFTIDHASRSDLVSKYAADNGVDTSKIEEVDFVWRGGPLSDAVPAAEHGTFDAFLASHVIEHTTDVVAFLKSAETLIRPEGVIILAVPDKRVCFDFYRPVSTTGEAIAAHRESRSYHDAKTHFDHGMYTAVRENSPGWLRSDTRPLTFNASIEHGLGFLSRADANAYIDAHHWVLVPASFELLVLELSCLGLLDLRVERLEVADATEFYTWLKRGKARGSSADIQELRRTLLERILLETAEQTRQIPGSPLNVAEARVRDLEAKLRLANAFAG